MFGFYRQEQQTRNICVTAVQTRQSMYQVIESVTPPLTTSPTQTPEQRANTERNNAARAEARGNAKAILIDSAPPCG